MKHGREDKAARERGKEFGKRYNVHHKELKSIEMNDWDYLMYRLFVDRWPNWPMIANVFVAAVVEPDAVVLDEGFLVQIQSKAD